VFILFVIFVAGVALDILHSQYVRHTAKGSRVWASLLSGCCTLIAMLVWGWVLKQTEVHGFAGILAMASGASVGSFVGIRPPRT